MLSLGMVPCVLCALEYCQLCTRSLPKRHGLVHIWQCTSVDLRSTPGVIPNGHGYAVPGHYRLIMPWYGAALIGQMLATT